MSKQLTKLGAALDKECWEWLLNNCAEIAEGVAAEVEAGASPDAIRRFILAHAGADRTGLASRCMSAARFLINQKAR